MHKDCMFIINNILFIDAVYGTSVLINVLTDMCSLADLFLVRQINVYLFLIIL